MYFAMSLVLNANVCGVRITPVASRAPGRPSPQTAITHARTTLHTFSRCIGNPLKGGGTATSSLFASASFPLPTTLTEFRALAFRHIHRRSITMYSLILLLLCFICQIATSGALVHGRYPRFNRLNNPNVSASEDILLYIVSLGSNVS